VPPNMFQRILSLGQLAGAQLQLFSQLLALSTSLRKNSNRFPCHRLVPDLIVAPRREWFFLNKPMAIVA